MESPSDGSLEYNPLDKIGGLDDKKSTQRPSSQAQSYKHDNRRELRDALSLQRRGSSQCGDKVLQIASDVIRHATSTAGNALGNTVNHLTSGIITAADFNRALNRIIPPPLPQGAPSPRDPFRDADFTRITELLKLHGKSEWSKRPRTFTLLRMTGSTDAIEAFIADHLSDLALPYTEQNLPNAVKGAQARAKFLDLQNLVRTHAADLEKGGNHMYFPQSASDYFQSLRELGEGGFGQVDHVWSRLSLRDFARKRIPRGRSFKSDKAAIANFETELGTLKLLSHQHLVRLIGSYTDPKFVGLIMHPVADMNLATYLNQNMDPRERQVCLRRFYGCLATAVLYLHDQKIRHKDIKPSNVLVRGSDVYLTDFGTSMHWDDGSRSTTMGTVPTRTPKYCPPEVWDQEERSTSSDIWCLGCCFLEMTTVLNNRTTKEMETFLGSHGTQRNFFHANEEATNMWIEVLKKASENRDDVVPLIELIHWMMTRLPRDRPTSHQVVNCILNFETRHAFYGVCCGNDEVTVQSAYENSPPSYAEISFDRQLEHFPTPSDYDSTVTAQSITSRTSRKKDSGDSSLVQLSLQDPLLSSNSTGKKVNKTVPPESDGKSASASSKLQNLESSTIPAVASPYYSVFEFLGFKNRAVPFTLYCQWPACYSTAKGNYFISKEHVEKHYRSIHESHEFSWSSLLTSEGSNGSSTSIRSRKASPHSMTAVLVRNRDREYPGPSSVWDSDDNTTESPMVLIGDSRNSKQHAQAESTKPQILQTGLGYSVRNNSSQSRAPNSPLPQGRPRGIPSIISNSNDKNTKKSSFLHGDSNQNEKDYPSRKTENDRFSLLPNDRRPEPTAVPAPDDNEEPDTYNYIAPQPLSLPSVGKGGRRKCAGVLPDNSRVPSYVLAGTNRFTNAEIDALVPRSRVSVQAPPLFVYGSFMFPSVIKAQASKSIKGIYSSRYQRRLVPDSIDWARANSSLKHVAEIMTPAVLKGFDRWKPKGLECATIIDSRTTNAVLALENISIPKGLRKLPDQEIFPGHVQGFLLFGFSEEVLKTCDEIFPLDHYRAKSDTETAENKREGHFERKVVEVDIQLSNGRPRTLEAITYTWHKRKASGARNFGLEGPWDINDFIKRPCFNSWSLAEAGDDTWTKEEDDLAKTMKITYILAGDALGHAVSEGDLEAVKELLMDGENVNGACRPYGTPLQTAVVSGNEEMVRLLLKKDADVNTEGGQYQTALLAAVVCGHEELVSLLLRCRADVLADCGFRVSALYQAVSHSDESIVYLLLEDGAWLSTGYLEVLDLAAERGNHRIMDMLMEYDVRKLHLALPLYHGSQERGRQPRPVPKGQEVALTSGTVLRAVISQALILKGSHGTWQGRKGVLVLKAALEAGAPETVIDQIGDNLRTVSSLIDYFRGAAMELLSPQPPSTKHLESVGPGVSHAEFSWSTQTSKDGGTIVEELDSSSDEDSNDDNATLIGNENKHDRVTAKGLGRTPDRGGQPPGRTPTAEPRFKLSISHANRHARALSDTSGGTSLKVPKSPQQEMAHSKSAQHRSFSISPPPRRQRRVCSACNGRGGRQGTGWQCTDCKGTARDSRCNACQGSGLIFSNRDRCRECGGSRFGYD